MSSAAKMEEGLGVMGEGMESGEEGEGCSEPAHHARRPMNAFLIFCKRHRSVVRDKYPSLENRCITKILGEWWAQLEPTEKTAYTELAKKYKEAFLEANPDFKWYKLPAPPLRTLVTRPSNQKPPKQLDMQSSLAGPIVPGKLADESQLGGLSSLLLAGAASGAWPPVPKPPKKRYLEEAATPLAAWEGTSSHLSPSQPGPSVAAPEEAAPAASGTPETNNNEASYTNEHAEEEEKGGEGKEAWPGETVRPRGGHGRRKSVRACKGKRYQEFMSTGRITTGKRGRLRMYSTHESSGKKRRLSNSSSNSEKTDASEAPEVPPPEADDDEVLPSFRKRNFSECSDDSELEAHLRKRFRAADFNLDEKIDALPSLSLEEFQQKKKAKKKRGASAPTTPKKHSARDRGGESTPVSKGSSEGSSCSTPSKVPPLVGSQKRKARRLQITRVDPNSVAREGEALLSDIGLATLAEVAAVTKRLIKQ